MTKRALLIGCQYPGTPDELAGTVPDILNIRSFLLDYGYFQDEDLAVLVDNDPGFPQPTGQNIMRALSHLARKAEPGDLIYVHYSGHGSACRAYPFQGDDDSVDQCICPTDGNFIFDDDFRDFMNRLPDGVSVTIVSDSCFSGGLVENTEVQIGPTPDEVELTYDKVVDVITSAKDTEGDDVKSRALPPGSLQTLMGMEVTPETTRMGLYLQFGNKAAPSVRKFAQVISTHFDDFQAVVEGQEDAEQVLDLAAQVKAKYEELLGGGEEEEDEEAAETYEDAEENLEAAFAALKSKKKGGWASALTESVVLITGCTPMQTSKDLGSGGAMTLSLLEALKESEGAVTYYDLVSAVREKVKAGGIEDQDPCLYCPGHMSNKTFLSNEESE